jgi:hypothetical protein
MAYTCDHCHESIESIDSNVNFCPSCGQPQILEDELGWNPIAKFGELAEAGYFADELRSEGIRSRIIASSDLEADGGWRSQFQLLTAEADSQRAREWLVRHIEEHDELGWNEANQPERLTPRRTGIAGMLLIVGSSLSAGLFMGAQLRSPDPAFIEFWDAVKSSPTYTTDPRLPGPRRRLDIDQDRGILRIRQDLDQDGEFDEQMEFRPAG